MPSQRTPEERFWSKVNVDGPLPPERPALGSCWLWMGSRIRGGYGEMQRGQRGAGKVHAHRFSYELHVGPIPREYQIDHLCRVPACVRPDHLEAVTQRENLLRGVGFIAEQARRTHCMKGHPYDEENTAVYDGHRVCKTCNRERVREYMRRKRAG